MKTCTLCMLLLLTLNSIPGYGQSWQWGQRGGSSSNGINQLPYEDVVDMDTDPNGNVYVLSIIESSGSPSVAGQPLTAYGGRDILLSSFDCEGNLKWEKVFGGWADDLAQSVKTDALGHVYVGGRVTPPSVPANTAVHFDSDTTLPHSNVKSPFLIQYDTSGVFQWLRMSQPDTMVRASSSKSGTLDMYVSPDGQIYWYGILNNGLLSGGGNHVIHVQAPYILKYNINGDLSDIITLDMEANASTIFDSRITRDPQNGRFYIAGSYYSGTLTMGGQPVTKRAFVGCFDAVGQFKWISESHTNTNSYILDRVQVDENGNIYVTGGTNHNNGFNGMTFYNTLSAAASFPFVMKLDSNGNTLWGINAQSQTLCEGRTSTLRNGILMIGGEYGNRVIFGTDTLMNTASITGQDCYIAMINTSDGSIIKLDTLNGAGFYDKITRMTSSRQGNFYVGGSFESELKIGGDTLYSAGGRTDFFVARYGNADCACDLPQPDFTYQHASGSKTVSFSYTGTAADSLRWTFGDGNQSTQQLPSHTYADTGTYRVCVYAYNTCGMDSVCQYIQVSGSSGISDDPVSASLDIYPNPSRGHVYITGLHGAASYRLYHATGRLVHEGVVSPAVPMVDITVFPDGVYVLELEAERATKTRIRLVKY